MIDNVSFLAGAFLVHLLWILSFMIALILNRKEAEK